MNNLVNDTLVAELVANELDQVVTLATRWSMGYITPRAASELIFETMKGFEWEDSFEAGNIFMAKMDSLIGFYNYAND